MRTAADLRRRIRAWCIVLVCLISAARVSAQQLSFHEYRKQKVPDYATIKLGPFYSDVVLSQSAGWRWSRATGAGLSITDGYNTGQILENGSDFPIITTLTFRNYLLISPHADLELAVRLQYKYFPLGTQDDEFNVDLTDEGIHAGLGLSTVLEFSPVLRTVVYERLTYHTEWLDLRGLLDPYGGSRFEPLINSLGANTSWLASKIDSINLNLNRTDVIPVGKSNEQFDTQEHHSYTEKLIWEHEQTQYFIWRLGADQQQTYYTHPDRDEEIYWWNVYFGVNMRLTKHIRVNSNIGYNGTRVNGETVENQRKSSGGSFDVSTTAPITERVTHSISASRRLGTAFEGGVKVTDSAQYQVDWVRMFLPGSAFVRYSTTSPEVDAVWGKYVNLAVGTGVTIPVTKRVSARLSTAYTTRQNTEGALPPPEGEEREPTTVNDYATWVTSLSSGVRIRKKVSLTGYVQHIERLSDNSDIEYTRDIVGLNVNWAHRF